MASAGTLLYIGRYDDIGDEIHIELIDGRAKASVSFGGTSIASIAVDHSSMPKLNDGTWHSIHLIIIDRVFPRIL